MALLIEKPQLVAEDHYLLKINMEGVLSEPGQFVNIKTTDSLDPLLRRPFSIFDHIGDILEVVVRVIGRGTENLRDLVPGDMNIIGPRGRGFTIEKDKDLLLIGGGVGNAPLLYLMKHLKEYGNRLTYIYCSRGKNYIFQIDRYRDLADDFIVTTDDGSEGIKGFATDVMSEIISESRFDRIYTCGPDLMMNKVVKLAHQSTNIEVSVENYFGCGVGLCVGCTVDTVDGYKRACAEGPVFDGRTILWNNMLSKEEC